MLKFHRIFPLILVFLLGVNACAPQKAAAPSPGLTILAATSLSECMKQLEAEFHKSSPDVPLSFSFAPSQQLARQILNGASADLFLSADRESVQMLVDNGGISPENRGEFIANRLLVIANLHSPVVRLLDLSKPGVKIVLASQESPAGKYTLQLLDKLNAEGALGENYQEQVLKNVVSYENSIRTVVTKVELGEADAGIVYQSDIYPAYIGKVRQILIPDSLNITAIYSYGIPNTTSRQDDARKFVELLISPEGQSIFQGCGFLPIQ